MRLAASFYVAVWGSVALGCHAAPAPLPPQPDTPVVAAPPPTTVTAHDACGALLTALESYRDCPHLGDRDRGVMQAWHDFAATHFAAAEATKLDQANLLTIARGCQSAQRSVALADQRCRAGEPRWTNPED